MVRSSSGYIFQKIAQEGRAEGHVRDNRQARQWFREKAGSFTRVDAQRIMDKNLNQLYDKVSPMDIGRMYMFFYDPKWKEKLPYYDRFPLIFVIRNYPDGFLGMNLHYLPPILRATLMDALYRIEKNDNPRQSKKLKMSYELLNGASQYKFFKPTVKRYLFNHVRSRFLWVPAEEWDIALMLPTERFKKARKNRVWKESKESIKV